MDEEKYGALQIKEMLRLLKDGFPLVFNQSLGRFDIKDSSFDSLTQTRYCRTSDRLPPLHRGAFLGRTDLMQRGLLFQRVNHVYNGFTALDFAVMASKMEAVKFFLNGSFFRDRIRNYNPLHQEERTLIRAVHHRADIQPA